jgi:hypothetical protein|tara:strand:- start:807 stop:1598 length:792 start_codon:yes stop_codon:yes gene_type:complete
MTRQELLESLADNHEAQIKKTLENLEEEIISTISRATEGELISTRIAIELRKDIKRHIQETYLFEADTIIREYDKIVNEFLNEFGTLNIPDKFKSLTKIDLETINALKYQSFSGFEDLANRYLTDISSNVYQNAIAGRSFRDMVKDIKGKVTGLEDRAGKPMSSHAGQLAHDSIMQFDGQFTIHKAKEAGLKHFKYTGTIMGTTRDFCRRHIGRTYNEKQIRAIWTGSWSGKSSGDPFIVRGGYRCRHTWLPVDKDWDIRDIT